MHCCYAAPEQWTGDTAELDREESGHLVRVLRGRPGDPVRVVDGRGRLAAGRVERADAQGARIRLEQVREVPEPRPRLVLLQALPKASRMDGIVQKAVELGVGALQALQTEHAVVRLDSSQAQARAERWRRIAREALKQCGAAWQMEVPPVLPLEQVPPPAVGEARLFGDLSPGAPPLAEAVACLRVEPGLHTVSFAVGPEGDFSPAERESLLARGARPVRFGDRVLRTETAALYFASVLGYELIRSRTDHGPRPPA